MSYTYAQLKTAIQDFTENDESTFVSNLDNFIQNAEQRIFELVDLQVFRKNVTASMTTGNKYLALPTDYLSTYSVSIVASGEKVFLEQKDPNFIQEYWPDASSTSQPKYYAIFDVSNYILGPTPDADYAVELHYNYRPNSLTAGAEGGTTWLSINAPNALLYGALLEAYTFMKGEEKLLTLYNSRFAESLTRLKNFAEARETSDLYRTGLVRTART